MEVSRIGTFLIFLFWNQHCNGQTIASIEDIRLVNYSKVAIPYLQESNKTADVNISLFILNIGNLNTQEMTFEAEMYFELKWTDPRLAFGEYHNASYALVAGMVRRYFLYWTLIIGTNQIGVNH